MQVCLEPGQASKQLTDIFCVQVWDANSGSTFTNIEPTEGSINDVCLWKDSGLIMLACDSPRIPVSPLHFGPSAPPPPPSIFGIGLTCCNLYNTCLQCLSVVMPRLGCACLVQIMMVSFSRQELSHAVLQGLQFVELCVGGLQSLRLCLST